MSPSYRTLKIWSFDARTRACIGRRCIRCGAGQTRRTRYDVLCT